jgi:asparagine synthase (glutamine-hydrolysing)
MCGIAAIYAYHYAANAVDGGELERICRAMAVRGPDGEGTWTDRQGRCGMGHRRLAILDLSPRGAQPMASADGSAVVTYNGEIYNYPELRRELEGQGVRFRSDCDTEVLLHLYQRDGLAMLPRLRGMFALALWDERRQGLLLARDTFGIKPLYYSDDGWTVRAASQVRALLAGGHIRAEVEPAAAAGFFLMGSVPEPWTIQRGVLSVPAGHSVWVDRLGAHAPVPYLTLTELVSNPAPAPADAGEALKAALRDSVAHHLLSDVPVAVFLSGGKDSSTLAALAAESNSGLLALTAAFHEYRDTPNDETPVAREVAEAVGIRHSLLWYNMNDLAADLDSFFASMDQPSVDGLNTWIISRAANEAGVKVVLSGLGGDELFCGYPSFRRLPPLVQALRPLSWLPGVAPIARGSLALGARVGLTLNPKLSALPGEAASLERAYLLNRALFLPHELPQILGADLAREGLARLQYQRLAGEFTCRHAGDRERISLLESSFYMRNQLLRDADWAGMAASVEIRLPLVDLEVFKAAIAGQRAKVVRDKQLLVDTMQMPLPQSVVNKPKTGFQVPISDWLELRPELDHWKRVPALRRRHTPWARRWAVTVWERYRASLS